MTPQEKETKLREAVEKKIKDLKVYRPTHTLLEIEILDFAKSEAAREYHKHELKEAINIDYLVVELKKDHLHHNFDLSTYKESEAHCIETAFNVGATCMYNKLLPHLQPKQESDAVEFAKWKDENFIPSLVKENEYIKKVLGDKVYFTLDEIYTEFKENQSK